MSLLHLAKDICRTAGVVLAFASAFYWFKASRAKITNPDNIHDPGIELSYKDKKGNDVQVVATAMEQSRLNMIAAVLTGLAVLFQGAASMIPSDY